MDALPAWLVNRLHILPGTLARSPGHISEQFATPTAALGLLPPYLARLPAPLLARWQASPGGHLVINAARHEFIAGPSTFRRRTLLDAAWLRLREAPDPIYFLQPLAQLIIHLLGWRQDNLLEEILKNARDFRQGVTTCFHAGYGLRPETRRQIDAYLAEGIAHYLANRRGFNTHDPRFEKLLRATVFNPRAYR